MSLKLYNKQVQNGNTGMFADSSAMEFILSLSIKTRGGKLRSTDVKYTIVGPASATMGTLIEAGFKHGQRLARLSDGVVTGFFAKMGKYRNDEEPKLIQENKKSYAILYLSNNPKVEDENSTLPQPLQVKTEKVFVPWLNDSVSRQDFKATIAQPIIVEGDSYSLGITRFGDDMKTYIEAFEMKYFAGCNIKCYTRTNNQELSNLDPSNEFADGWMSEAHEGVAQGIDDGQTLVPHNALN
jgi:hypothetical protein